MLQSRGFIAEHNYHRRTLCSYFWRWRRLRLRFTKTCWGFTKGLFFAIFGLLWMEIGPPAQQHFNRVLFLSVAWLKWTRGQKGHISCTWVQCARESARAAILFFLISPKNTNLVEDVEISLPVKFHWILFNRFRREVENVSAHQRPGRPSCFSDRPEKKTW